MPVSKITSKFQTTVPKEVRKKLYISPNDSLNWEVRDQTAIVSPAIGKFLRWKGYVKVGKGSIVSDVKKARNLRGRKKF